MSGGTNLTLVALDRANKTFRLALELEDSARRPTRVNRFEVIVDLEVTLGAVVGLSKLVEKIEGKARSEFGEIIKNTRAKLLSVKEELDQKDTQEKVQSIVDDKMEKPGKQEKISTSKSTPLKNQKKLPEPDFHFAENNQYSETFDTYYVNKDHKSSASTSITSIFVLSIMHGIGPEAMGASLHNGHEFHARMMKDRPPAKGKHIDIQELLGRKEFEDLKQVSIPADIDLLQGKDAFHQQLEALQQIQKAQNLGKLGAVLSARGESYALLFVKDPYAEFILFFDPHGCEDLTYDSRAYGAGWPTSTEAAAEFLAKRMPKVESVEDRHYNICTITPLCLKK